ncbi:MAG: phage tail protein [Alphaproteobacteria bacterium]|nr:phage tail protein [Alphaproteobacteria bacterium]
MSNGNRQIPYGAFNFQVSIPELDPQDHVTGGFSDVSGLGTEFTVAEYRTGNAKGNHVRKVAGLFKVSDVTLKRGLINTKKMWEWIEAVRTTGSLARKDVVITLQDEAGEPAASWTLRGAIPLKWTGPTLAAKAHGDVAMEEIVLSIESLELN